MSEVAVRDQQAVATTPDSVSFVQMIERASRDPSVDIDKMERLMAMHERMIIRQAEADFNDALRDCQKEVGTIAADANNPQTKSRYATYAKLDRALRPIYTKHGISISYSTGDTPKPDCVRVLAFAARGAYTREYHVDMPADGKGAKGGDVMTKTHATGAAMAYGARYLLKGIFNISVGEDDDDGNMKRRTLDEAAKKGFLEMVEACETVAQWQTLWNDMSAATTKAGDVATHEEFRAAMAPKYKALTAKPKKEEGAL